MVPKIRVDLICAGGDDIIGFWKETYDVSSEIDSVLNTLSMELFLQGAYKLQEIAVRVTVIDEMPSINLQPALLQKIHTLKASLDIDIIQTAGK